MPEGRLIKRKIADNERVNSQPVPARLLYDRLIQFVDREGRHHANPRLLLRRFFPLDDFADEEMAGWLQGLHDAKKDGKGLIELYEIDGLKYLYLPGFEGEQSKTWLNWIKKQEATSSIPSPTKEGRRPSKPSPEIVSTPFEDELYEVIKTMSGWEPDKNEDLAWLRELTQDFQNVTVALLKGCRDRNSDSSAKKGAWKNRMRNWLTNESKFSKEKQSGKGQQNPRQLIERDRYTDPDSS